MQKSTDISPASPKQRIQSIDILRGLVMVIMALDHARDYFQLGVLSGLNDPTNLETTTPILFFTRFITHFCAPIFIFLAGTSGYLYSLKRSKKELSKFLFTRGFWLIVVEIVIINFIWWFDTSFGFINLQVIWAIGLCMIIMSLLIYLPNKIIIAFGLVMVFGHNLTDGITAEGNSLFSVFWYVLHQPHFFQISENHFLSIMYPILPWVGVMALGYCFGRLYSSGYNTELRKKWLLWLGISTTALFFILRIINIYGDPVPWSIQNGISYSVISFLNVTKYPPSLAFLLITLGPSFLFLYAIERIRNRTTNFFLVFGRVPFFYYVFHLLVIHIFAMIGLVITGGKWKLMILSEMPTSGHLSEYGYNLWVVYVVWIFLIAILYPICKKYMLYKKKNKDRWWLGYL